MDKFKTVLGSIILVLSFGATYGTYLVQQTLERWISFGIADPMWGIGTDLWILVPTLYVLCLAFGLIGVYMLYDGIHVHS